MVDVSMRCNEKNTLDEHVTAAIAPRYVAGGAARMSKKEKPDRARIREFAAFLAALGQPVTGVDR